MSTPITGTGGGVRIATTTYNVEQWALNLGNELQETSDTGSNWVTRIAGYSSADGTFSIFLDSTSAAAQIGAFTPGTTIAANFALGATTHGFSGNFIIAGCNVSNPAKSPVKLDVSASSTGTVSFS